MTRRQRKDAPPVPAHTVPALRLAVGDDDRDHASASPPPVARKPPRARKRRPKFVF